MMEFDNKFEFEFELFNKNRKIVVSIYFIPDTVYDEKYDQYYLNLKRQNSSYIIMWEDGEVHDETNYSLQLLNDAVQWLYFQEPQPYTTIRRYSSIEVVEE